MGDPLAIPDYTAMARLDGKTFVVIGAGQGIGRQTAHALSQAGARVGCIGRDPDRTTRVAEETGGFALIGDASKRADAERMFAEAEAKTGAIHGVVDILGMPRIKPLLEFTDEDWDWQLDMVLRHAFLAIQLGGRAIARAGGGSITLVGSTSGQVIAPNQAVYGAAKAALNHLTAYAAVELGKSGIRVNAIVPGVTRTPRLESALNADQWRDIGEANPLSRAALPAQIASAILFAASDLASHITGQAIVVDGGGTLTQGRRNRPFPSTEPART
jgi:NAD(P)-dependent dehydrogenase (short-subunit alcohol dehydrogenase family)